MIRPQSSRASLLSVTALAVTIFIALLIFFTAQTFLFPSFQQSQVLPFSRDAPILFFSSLTLSSFMSIPGIYKKTFTGTKISFKQNRMRRNRIRNSRYVRDRNPIQNNNINRQFRRSRQILRPEVRNLHALSLSDVQRIRQVLRRLSHYEGSGRGFAKVTHVIVSLVGIFGMFSAVIGALLAPWLVEAGNSVVDDDSFVYWVRADEDEEDEDDQRTCGAYRERTFSLVRLLDNS